MKNLIVGGGMSGLYLAYRCENLNEDYMLLEASEHLGGRMKGMPLDNITDIELGATWFWQDMQPALARLITELGLEYYDDYLGEILTENMPGQPPVRVNYPFVSGQRVRGGFSKVITQLAEKIPAERVRVQASVREIRLNDTMVAGTSEPLEVILANGERLYADRVWLAMPPRLAAETLHFEPDLPENLRKKWLNTDTWMAPHAKYVAIFDQPFWREAGLSGHGFSQVGPMTEIHELYGDNPTGCAALFGFVGIPAAARKQLGEDKLVNLGVEQLRRLFGNGVDQHLVRVHVEDWAQNPLIATERDGKSKGAHPTPAYPMASEGVWRGRVIGVGSEFSPEFTGLVGGSVDAVDRAVNALLAA